MFGGLFARLTTMKNIKEKKARCEDFLGVGVGRLTSGVTCVSGQGCGLFLFFLPVRFAGS